MMASIKTGVTVMILCLLLQGAQALAAQIPPAQRPIHVLNRLAFGPGPGDLERVNEIGVQRYIQEQLHPELIPVPAALQSQLDALDTLRMTPVELFMAYRPFQPGAKTAGTEAGATEQAKAARQRARIVMEQAAQARLVRAIEDPRQLQQVMVYFWFNHFNVFVGKGLDYLWTGAFEQEAIRPYALGRFRDLLGATASHPAMLFYLDNWLNTGPGTPGARGKFEGLNENYARELMELHTLGVNGGYTQHDVIELARIFTGWGLVNRGGARRSGLWRWLRRTSGEGAGTGSGFYFDPARHDFGNKIFLGHTIEGSGMGEGQQALDILARNPATANHIAYELTQYFVADDPPPALVARLSATFLNTDGDIRAVLDALFHSPEFWDRKYYANRFKTPYQFVVSAVRAVGVSPRNFRPLLGTMAQLGEPLYACQTPDGYKFTQAAWLNPDAMMRRLSFATALGNGRLPLTTLPPEDGPEGGAITPAAMPPPRAPAINPPDPYELAATVGNSFTHQTAATVRESPPQLRAALILGSPEFMMH
ncbi:MAG TPA: DUF1800 domain-containing protein [Candidatus Binataceae bacterium]|jgi:uncharacterized protein (DUF1800 family)|nr:DUF1800 domain-containing protein [Candidatus Binataceae bacterium]